ncbi:MAG: tRNA-(ms[2]io[6]A)-hydroxylase [Myxococcales bacterium]|nr:tRNA-(ms[2]io[6]A)-hydroxylase [Myxococcales bacterium]
MFCLTCPTDPRWAPCAADALDRVLVDHAHCEMKAASSALSLSARCLDAPHAVLPLVALAREELEHFERVLVELERRGLALGPPPVDAYAAELRRRARTSCRGDATKYVLSDRLLVGALIEARSCERFKLLAEELERRGHDAEAALYRELLASEARHYTTLRQLAIDVRGDEPATLRRLGELARLEGEIVASLPVEAAIHG